MMDIKYNGNDIDLNSFVDGEALLLQRLNTKAKWFTHEYPAEYGIIDWDWLSTRSNDINSIINTIQNKLAEEEGVESVRLTDILNDNNKITMQFTIQTIYNTTILNTTL